MIKKFHKFRELAITEGKIITQLMGFTLMETFLLTADNHASVFVQPCKTNGVTETFKVSVIVSYGWLFALWSGQLFVYCVVRSAVCLLCGQISCLFALWSGQLFV